METPAPGQRYRHYKNDPNKGDYEIIAIGWDTESKEEVVLYKPLYKDVFLPTTKATVYVRPLSVFFEVVQWEGQSVPRFQKIN